jgi:hypothetical protein
VHSHDSHEHDHGSHHQGHVAELPRDTEGLPDARKTELVELADGDEYELEIIPVKKRIGDATVRMLTYNGRLRTSFLSLPRRRRNRTLVTVATILLFARTVQWPVRSKLASPSRPRGRRSVDLAGPSRHLGRLLDDQHRRLVGLVVATPRSAGARR